MAVNARDETDLGKDGGAGTYKIVSEGTKSYTYWFDDSPAASDCDKDLEVTNVYEPDAVCSSTQNAQKF